MEKMRILIVEDDEQLQKTYARFFRGHELVVCTTGEKAISLLSTSSFDVVLSDFNLDGALTGEDVLGWIRQNKPELLERFIFCSANERARELHHRVFEKPFDLRQLIKAVEETL